MELFFKTLFTGIKDGAIAASHKNHYILATIIVICGVTMASCFSGSEKSTVDVLVAPDYQDSTRMFPDFQIVMEQPKG